MTATGDEGCTGEDFTDAVFADQEWEGRCFVGCRFIDANLRGLRTRSCRFTDCDFTRADLGASEHRATAFHTCTFQPTPAPSSAPRWPTPCWRAALCWAARSATAGCGRGRCARST